MTLNGYARVSTDGQTLDSQISQLKSIGCLEIFKEKVSGGNSDRAQLKKVLGKLGQRRCCRCNQVGSSGKIDPGFTQHSRIVR